MKTATRVLCSGLLAALLVLPAAADGARLQAEASPYLRAHAAGPVDWMPWGDEALARAKAENKLLYVVVGAYTSELARAMNTQSFANPEVAAKLNERFVCVLVDRDERPGLAMTLQNYVLTTKQLTGWPVNAWLTPELQPVEALTYLPPSEEWGKEGLLNVVTRVANAWQSDPEGQRARAEQQLGDFAASLLAAEPADAAAVKAKLAESADAWKAAAATDGPGFGDAPRTLEPELIRFFLARGGAERELALAQLRSWLKSGARDPLDGGFYRGIGDGAGVRPAFVRTAADQARIALALLDAVEIAPDAAMAEAARGALRFAVANFQAEDGGFITSEDALGDDSAVGMTWTWSEILALAGDKAGAEFCARHGVTEAGNITEADDPSGKLKGRNYLQGGELASADTAVAGQLLKARRARVKWQRDDNRRAAVNGLLVAALARAGRQLDDAALRSAAERGGQFLRQALRAKDDGSLLRLRGSNVAAAADDVAYVAYAWAELGRASRQAGLNAEAGRWVRAAVQRFLEPTSGRLLGGATPVLPGWPAALPPVPAAGDFPAAELGVLEAVRLLDEPAVAGEARQALRNGLHAALADPAGPAKGDLLLAAARLEP